MLFWTEFESYPKAINAQVLYRVNVVLLSHCKPFHYRINREHKALYCKHKQRP